MEILYLRSTVKKINNQAIRVPHLAKPQNVNNKFEKNDEKNTLFKNNIDNNIYNAKYKLWK